ncbi:MAG: 50S ribosomal protein L7/L12 [Faecalibacterium sp.]|jgi:large subunit ribosomal protein L7/L12|nr:50S ribosomal protein L7/L12 [Faecalibacterium sp.]
MASEKITAIIGSIKELSVLELKELIDTYCEEFGVSAVAAAAAPAAGGAAAGAAEEKTEFDVVLAEVGDQKMQVIKNVKEITGLGLKEAKDLVDGAPKTIKEKASKADAEDIKKKLEAVGAKIELK